jgi:hypothetical protein
MALLHRNALDTSLVEPWLKRLGEGIKPPRTRGPLSEWPSASAFKVVPTSCTTQSCSRRSRQTART